VSLIEHLQQAEDEFAGDALWNTLAFVARAAALIEAGREYVPALERRLRQAAVFGGTDHERWALRQAHALAWAATLPCPALPVAK
jgi:hypothetical protein